MTVVIVVALLVVLYLLFARGHELFWVSVRSGKVNVVRGYVPPGLLRDFRSALRQVQSAEIRAHKAGGGARLRFSGKLDDSVAQQLRNIFGLYPISKLSAPQIDKRQMVSDAFTIGWLLSLVRSLFRW
jgi:hypothetical protein